MSKSKNSMTTDQKIEEQLRIALSLARGNAPAITSMGKRLNLIAGAIEKALAKAEQKQKENQK